jgi:hypothetical protein
LICSFLDVSLGHPLCQKPPRLISGTTSILLDSRDDALNNPAVKKMKKKSFKNIKKSQKVKRVRKK